LNTATTRPYTTSTVEAASVRFARWTTAWTSLARMGDRPVTNDRVDVQAEVLLDQLARAVGVRLELAWWSGRCCC
jgi:hypothetical protein